MNEAPGQDQPKQDPPGHNPQPAQPPQSTANTNPATPAQAPSAGTPPNEPDSIKLEQNKPPENPTTDSSKPHLSPYLIAVIAFLVGIGIGFALTKTFPASKVASVSQDETAKPKENIVLPKDTVEVKACSDNEGALFAVAKELPGGPIYITDRTKVVGIKYTLSEEEYAKGKKINTPLIRNLNVDHIKTYVEDNRYNFDFYLISEDQLKKVTCPEAVPTEAQPSAGLTPVATEEASITIPPTSAPNLIPSAPAATITP